TRTGRRLTIEEAYKMQGIEVATLGDGYRLKSQTPSDYVDNGIRPCYRVTTHLGREIEVTLNHPFLTLDGWQPLEKLEVGNRVAVPRALPYFGAAQISDAHVKLLAHLLAEGTLTRELPYFTNTNPDMKDDFSKAVTEAFPNLQAHWHPDGRSCSVSAGRRGPNFSNPCTQWLRELGLMGTNSGTKFIPDLVFTLPRRQVALFLNRLFSGDGFLHTRSAPKKQATIDYAGKSKRLIQG